MRLVFVSMEFMEFGLFTGVYNRLGQAEKKSMYY